MCRCSMEMFKARFKGILWLWRYNKTRNNKKKSLAHCHWRVVDSLSQGIVLVAQSGKDPLAIGEERNEAITISYLNG